MPDSPLTPRHSAFALFTPPLQPARQQRRTPRQDPCTGGRCWCCVGVGNKGSCAVGNSWAGSLQRFGAVTDAQPLARHGASGPSLYQPPCSCLRSPIPFTPTGSKTLYDNWTAVVERYGPRPCLGRRSGTTYSYLTYAVRWLCSAVCCSIGSDEPTERQLLQPDHPCCGRRRGSDCLLDAAPAKGAAAAEGRSAAQVGRSFASETLMTRALPPFRVRAGGGPAGG